MGLVKTIYNVLGGFYSDYNSTNPLKSVHKLNKSFQFFLCTFLPSIFILSNSQKNMHKKPRFLHPCFVFVIFRSILFIINESFFLFKAKNCHKYTCDSFLKNYSVSRLFSKSASNSSFEIFSFSKRSSAQLSNTSRYSIIMRFASAYASSIMRLISLSMAVATPSL